MQRDAAGYRRSQHQVAQFHQPSHNPHHQAGGHGSRYDPVWDEVSVPARPSCDVSR